jgi:predicted TIM-barrel enzyme
MPRMMRDALMDRFRAMVQAGQPILCEEAGGIDLIVIYNSGRYRMAGRGSLAGMLAYGNANEIVVEMAREVLPVVRHTPVLAGVNGTDPFCHFDHFLDQLKALGFSGVQNFPTVGLIDGTVGGGDDCPCPGQGSAHHALCLQPGRGAGHGGCGG